jgi:hypothetical protein
MPSTVIQSAAKNPVHHHTPAPSRSVILSEAKNPDVKRAHAPTAANPAPPLRLTERGLGGEVRRETSTHTTQQPGNAE